MPDQIVPTTPTALALEFHGEAVTRVEVADLSRGGADRLVSLAIGDDRQGVHIIGEGGHLHALIVEADRQLTRLATEELQ